MKRLSWKYIAGLVDGEACLDVQVNNGSYVRPRLRIALVESSRFVLESLKDSFGGSIYERKKNEKNPNWQNSVSWELCGYHLVCPVLRNISNHLLIKKEQARLLLWMEQEVKGKQVANEARQLIIDELKAMKRDPHRLSEKAQSEIISVMR